MMYIAFEGLDCSGKTTLSRIFYDKMLIHNQDSIYLCEPTHSSPYSQELRTKLGKENFPLDEQVSLFVKDREWNMRYIIKNNMHRNIIQDRSYISNIAYQGAGGFDIENIKELNSNIIKPDVIFFIDVSFDVLMERLGKRYKNDVFEKREFLEKVYKIYKDELNKLDNVFYFYGNKSLDDLSNDIFNQYVELKNIEDD